ncbi:MAG: hypothetical protein IPH63_08050 [Flavobacteriales bacterium]|nr:hypothetical protein [Flavobacteriales bacterium]
MAFSRTAITLKPVFPDIADYSVGIINMLMVLGMPLCAFVLFALFRSFDVRPWLAQQVPSASRSLRHRPTGSEGTSA